MNPRLIVLALLFSMVLTGCGGGGSSPGDTTTRAAFTIHWPNRSGRMIPVACESIKVTISNPQGQAVATDLIQRPAGGGDVTVTISPLPAGDLPVSAVAYPNADGTGIAQGTASVVLHSVAGQLQSITISLDSTITSVDITATSLNVPTGGFQQLTATPRNQNGDVVITLPKTITWQSSNTAVATVDSTGKVTGVASGTANITVTETESGKTKTVGVTVGTSSSAGGVIAFVSGIFGRSTVYAMRGDGSALTNIIPEPSLSNIWYSPAVSPNGQYVAVAYHGGADIYDHMFVVKANGTGRPATWSADMDGGFSWAPDSSRLVYSYYDFSRRGLHIINADGTGDVKISDIGYHPQWSPDGTRIVTEDNSTNQLFLIGPDGTNRQNVTQGYDPMWFPSGNRIAFHGAVVGQGLKMINIDGTGETLVSALNVGGYSVSPDGSKIVFSGSPLGGGNPTVYVYSVGSGVTVPLQGPLYTPAWSPDSKWLAYGSTTGIHMIKPDGSGDYILPGIDSASWMDWR